MRSRRKFLFEASAVFASTAFAKTIQIKGQITMGVFHVYPSATQAIAAYSRSIPLQCDTIEINTLTRGYFDTTGHCFVATAPVIMQFYANVLLSSPPLGACINVWLFKNVLPPPDGSSNGEWCGDDVSVYQPSSLGNVSARIQRIMSLQTGDRVWAVPGINCGGALTGASNAGVNTVNYFEGIEVG